MFFQQHEIDRTLDLCALGMDDNCLFFDSKSNFGPLLFFPLYTGTGSFRPIQTRLAPSSRLPLSKASPAASSSSATATQLSSLYCFNWLIYFCFFPWQLCYPFCAVIKGLHRYSFVLHIHPPPHVASAPCSLNYWTFHSSILSASVAVGAYQMWQIPRGHLLLIPSQVPLTWQPNLRASSLVVPVGSWPRLLLTTRWWSLLLPLLKTNQTLTSSSTVSQRSAAHASSSL